MMTRPVSSSSVRGVNVTLVVTVNSGAGNFCSSRFGTSQRFRAPSGVGTLNRLNEPIADGRTQFDWGFACHSHCNPREGLSNSSESDGAEIGQLPPTFGFL